MRLQDLLAPTDKFLKQYVGTCGTCPRKLQGFVPPTLRPSKLIVVGEAPGATEVETQEGFTGKSGLTLRAALRDAGIPPEEISYTNTIHCRPPENRDPDPKEIGACMNAHVLGEVKDYPLVVLTGNISINAFFPSNAQQCKGNLAYHPDFPATRFFSMLHPAAIGYDPKRKDEFYGQIDRLARIYRGDTEAKFRVVDGEEFRTRWGEFLRTSAFLSLDLETDRLKSWEPGGKIKSLSACDLVSNEVFSIDESDPSFIPALQALAEWLQNPENQVLGQNIGFDLVWMESEFRFKCNLKYIHDTQVLYYELRGSKQQPLKPLVAEELDGYRHLVVWPHLEQNPERLRKYNSEDVWYPRLLFLRDFPKLHPTTRDLCTRVLGPSSLALRRVTHAGIYFRSEAWGPLDQEYKQLREAEITAWQAEIPENINIRQYVTPTGFSDLEEYIYQVRKYPVINTTAKSDKPSTDDSTIKELIRGGAKELEHCIAIKGIDKRISTYIKALPKKVAKDRRIHAGYHGTTVDTSRTSSSDPNMQNNPRLDPIRDNQIRWLFGASPGCKLVDGDFSQIELREGMCLAFDPVGMQVYVKGGDIHIETARSILGDEPQDPADWQKGKWKDARSKAKPVNFGCLFGAEWPTLQRYAADEYGIILTDSEAKRWREGFFGTYKSLLGWHDSEREKLQVNKGHVMSATGHCWYYADWNSKDDSARQHAERQAINATCQGPAANMMCYLIYLVQQEFWKQGVERLDGRPAEVVLTVHDSLGAEVIGRDVERSIQVVRQCLHTVEAWVKSWFTVPLVLDIKVSEIWDG